MSAKDKEPFSPDFRFETVIRTLKEIANSESFYDWEAYTRMNKNLNDEMSKSISRCMSRIQQGAQVFANPTSLQAERDAIEPQLFVDIMYLKSLGLLRPNIVKDEILRGIARVEIKQDSLSVLMKDILIVLTGLTEKVEALNK